MWAASNCTTGSFPRSTFQRMVGKQGGTTGVDDDFAARGIANIGAWILGRNMFGPIRGDWPDDAWKGWWGDNPPYHTDVFVLTHHPRASIRMEGDTTFHFVTEGIHAALERARAAAKGRDVRVGGGVATIQQYLRAGLIDEMHVAIAPSAARIGRASVQRARRDEARLSMRRARAYEPRDAHRPEEVSRPRT